jgi:polyhydroxyalkanoate synthesis regulator protein
LIGYYDDSLRAFLPRYLEVSMENFAANQEQIRRYIEGTFGQFFPVSQFEDMARQNMALFQRAATMFTPNSGNTTATATDQDGASAPDRAQEAAPGTSQEIKDLNEKIEVLEKQVSRLVEAQQDKG